MRCLFFAVWAATSIVAGLRSTPANAEDGYDLWLRYMPSPAAPVGEASLARSIVTAADPSPTLQAAAGELRTALSGIFARTLAESTSIEQGSVVLARPSDFPEIDALSLQADMLGRDGYLLRSVDLEGGRVTLIFGNTDVAVLYGAFALLRHLQTGGSLSQLNVSATPRVDRRLLNHWDNLDGTVERGYAGQSLWDWWRLPEYIDPRYVDYARANASIGINGVVLNNVNAQAAILSARYLEKIAALAGVLRAYGIRVYLSVRFSSPIELGGLDTADPLEHSVAQWWAAKAEEIYSQIPDFGGFLVKADSEGQPGPQRYGRTHADGANVLAAALRPHGGVVFWRAFVYSHNDPEDRVKQAFQEFRPLDGQFADNVILQVKNGPLDFQPREPFHPLFGAMPQTPLAMEFQITQEYLGFSTHLAYLGTLYEEVLDTDTHTAGPGSTVAHVIDGSLHGHSLTAIAGVSNIGNDRDWTGAPFTQANWYAFGRLAWNPQADSRDIAKEWLRMTFSNDGEFLEAALDIMLRSREAVVDYMTPLGLAHLMGTGHHYGPAPWVDDLDRPEWNPYYYHRADAQFIGLDRTQKGSDAVSQYAEPVASVFADVDSVPEEYLLWFHRLPWDFRLDSGDTLWQQLVAHYDRGVEAVADMLRSWVTLEEYVDADRFEKVSAFLQTQLREARWWRDACLAYFADVSGLALPEGVRQPEHSLEYYMQLSFPNAPGR